MSISAPPRPTPDEVRPEAPRQVPPRRVTPTPLARRSLLLPCSAFAVFATSLSLAQVFLRQAWLGTSILAIGVAFGAGWVSRRLDVPGLLAPALSVLALVTFLGIVFHAGTTIAGIPTASTMRAIGESLSAAGRDIRELAAPVDATPGLTLLATAGVFVVAMLVDIVVFRLNRPVAAGMPLLALFLVPTAMTSHANALAFVVAAFGFLALLVAEGRDRARGWGRRLTGIDLVDETADVAHVARVGRRIGTAAIGVALCVPLALPSVGKGVLGGGAGGLLGSGSGSTTVTVVNPIVEIYGRLHDTPRKQVLTMTTSADRPDYLRLTTLNQFDGRQWLFVERRVSADHRVGRKHPVPLPDELADITTVRETYDLDISGLDVRWLPLPYFPAVVDADGDWRYEDTGYSVFSARRSTRGAHVSVTAERPAPTPDQLRAAGEPPESLHAYLATPPKTPPFVLSELNRVTKNGATPYDKAVALQEYFKHTGGFHYTLEGPRGSSTDVVTQFLKEKQGFCEQFAGAFAYMARLLGIPARVVVGFLPGSRADDGTFTVTNEDAHAWPELYFENAGWVRFEPTPRPANDTITPSYALPPVSDGSGDGQTPSDPQQPADPKDPQDPQTKRPGHGRDEATENDEDAATPPAPGARGNGAPLRLPLLPTALVLALVVLVTPTLVAEGTRRRRRGRATDGQGRIHAAWATLADAAEDTGHPLRAADSPRAAARRLVAAASLEGEAADAVTALARAEERARYAPVSPDADGLDAGLRTVRRALRGSQSRWARVRSTVFPASSVRRIRTATHDTAAALERARTAATERVAAVVLRRRRARTA
ncbi:MAG TPA: DUF3488 and transglutaminase-like domain-containing protein [Mycobacteriales bacterium]|jgi:hypothetical protein|nr:DUF3488 and transglutaminase-like domain-containing protein [Mycobacteriales bacterium]